MSMGEMINYYGSLMCLMACLLFIAVYSVMPVLTGRTRWWSSHIGRMMITKAAALAGLMLIVVVYYLTGINQEWIRWASGVLSSVIGLMMIYQSWMVVRLQRRQGDN